MLHTWLYRSRALVAPRSVADGLIYLQARQFNATLGVTGYLHREDGFYVQYIEGPRDGLVRLAGVIRGDGRHMEVETLARGTTSQHRFEGWDMAFTTADAMEGTMSFAAWQIERGRFERLFEADAPCMLEFMSTAAAAGAARSVADHLPQPARVRSGHILAVDRTAAGIQLPTA